MKKILLLIIAIVAITTGLKAQNKYWILAPYYSDLTNSIPLPTSSSPDGYHGQVAQCAQNIQMDASGNILFFIVDGKIYGKNGELIDVISEEAPGTPIAPGENSELVVIPDRDNCNLFHILTTKYIPISVEYSKSYYARLIINYDAQGNVSANSGIEYINLPFDDRLVELGSMVGAEFYADNNVHDERAIFAVVPNISNSGYTVFVENGQKIFRFSINNGVFNYDNYFINFVTFCNLQQGGNESVRGELEAIRLSNGNIRLGRAGVFYHFSEPAKTGVITIDANSSGTFIANSYKFCDYLPNSFSITPNQTYRTTVINPSFVKKTQL